MSDNRYYVNYLRLRQPGPPSALRFRDQFDHIHHGITAAKEVAHTLIQGRKLSLLVYCQPEKIGVRDLLMPHQAVLNRSKGVAQ